MPYRRLIAGFFACALTLAPLTAVRAAGTLRVASDISYAPLEFYKTGTKQVVGFDYDLARAIAAHMGRSLVFRNQNFDTILDGLGTKDDVVISSMSDTLAREKRVDFIDYFLSGTGILTRAGNAAQLWDVSTLCGRTVDVQTGTSAETTLKKQQDACKSVGLGPITVLAKPTDDAALAELDAGRSVAHISDYPVVAYIARTRDGGKTYQVVGRPFDQVPFGIAVAKTNRALRNQVQTALVAVIRDGTYDRLLKRWHLERGGLRSAPVNAGPTFQR
jgi:polar amino acid transport system substrate-binding protein